MGICDRFFCAESLCCADGKPLISPVTSHVLDTARGSPAEGVTIVLERKAAGSSDVWEGVSSGVTNSDGRVPNLLEPSATIEPGTYRYVNALQYSSQPSVPYYLADINKCGC